MSRVRVVPAPCCGLLLLVALLLPGACPWAQSSPFEPFDQHDYEVLVRLADGSGETARLAAAVVSSMRYQDRVAQAALETLIEESGDPAIVSRARRSLSGVHVRQGRYAEAAAVMKQILQMPDAGEVAPDPGAVAFFSALGAGPPMGRQGARSGRVVIRRDAASLPRVDITVNDVPDQTIVDTGAALSVVTVSTANRMHLQQLGVEVRVGGATGQQVSSGLAMADELRLGDTVFLNVPFVVVADDAMHFPDAGYQASSILGLPILVALERLVFSRADDGEILEFGPSDERLDPAAVNLITSGWEMVVLARVGGAPVRHRLQLDTGARVSVLYRMIADSLPGLLADATVQQSRIGGLGGELITRERPVVDSLAMQIGGREVDLAAIPVEDDNGSFRHGVLGQDILTRLPRLIIDFTAMRLSLEGEPLDR